MDDQLHCTVPGPHHFLLEHIYGIHPYSSSLLSLSNDNDNSDNIMVDLSRQRKKKKGMIDRSNDCDDKYQCNNINLLSSQGHWYYSTCPIPLSNTAKVDLKKLKEIWMLEHILLSFGLSSSSLQCTTIAGDGNGLNIDIAKGRGKGPITLVVIHLCETLSLKAVE